MENKIVVKVMYNQRDGFSYCVYHPLIKKLFKVNEIKNDKSRPVKRDDINSVLGRIARRLLTAQARNRKNNG